MIKLTRYCENCKEEVEAVVINADSIWCPFCLDDLKYYDYDREMADEEAILMEFERFSGAMDVMYKPVRKYGILVSPQAVKINSGKYAGREGVILDDKSDGYYKINVTPEKATVEAVDIHESEFIAIERLSMFTTINAA